MYAAAPQIISLDRLRTDFKQFEQKRDLLATYDLFLADDRILPMLCKTLGKTFFSRKKQPIPLNLLRKTTLPQRMTQARDSTYMYLSSGVTISVATGTTAMTAEAITENILAVAPTCINKVRPHTGTSYMSVCPALHPRSRPLSWTLSHLSAPPRPRPVNVHNDAFSCPVVRCPRSGRMCRP